MEEIDKKVNDLVIKKLENIKEVLLNTSEWNKKQAWNPGISPRLIEELLGKAEIKKELANLVEKEIYLALPNSSKDDLLKNKKDNVNRVFEYVDDKTRGKIRFSYGEIENLIK